MCVVWGGRGGGGGPGRCVVAGWKVKISDQNDQISGQNFSSLLQSSNFFWLVLDAMSTVLRAELVDAVVRCLWSSSLGMALSRHPASVRDAGHPVPPHPERPQPDRGGRRHCGRSA